MTESIRAKILAAAERRFADYGFQKTTMAEIAADCGMSVGNVYRHFTNKSAIAAASVQRVMALKHAAGQQAAKAGGDVLSCLQAMLLARLQVTHDYCAGHRHLHECVAVIGNEHADLLDAAERQAVADLAELLQQGMVAGELAVRDAARVAWLLHQAMMRYNHPLSLQRNDLAGLERDMCDSLALFYEGLRSV